MESAEVIERSLDSAFRTIERINDEHTKKYYRRNMAILSLSVYENMMQDIVKQYPELDPDKC